MNIPFSPPDISQAEIDEVCDALRSGWITTGPKTKELEREVAQLCHTQKAACLNSATAALELGLFALGIGEGDEVITSAYTYTASASPAMHLGAKLKLVDIQEDSFEMDYNKLAAEINDKTKVVIPVDIGGKICDYDTIFESVQSMHFSPKANSLQECFDRPIIFADAAHSFGATQNNIPSGAHADFSSFSFHAVKNFTTAEGGALTWKERPGLDSDGLYKNIMLYSLHGQSKDALAKTQLGAWEYDIKHAGYKCNMTDIHAAIGLAQMKRYKGMLARRKEIITCYNEAFSDREKFSYLEHFGDNFASSGHLYLLSLKGISREQRDDFIISMAKRGVATNVHYKPLPLMSAYKALGFRIEDFPNALKRFESEVTLPLYSTLSDEQVQYIVDCVQQCYEEIY